MTGNQKPETSTPQHIHASIHYALTAILFLVFITLSGCRSTALNDDQVLELESLAKRKLGKDYMIEYNDSKKFALCQQNPLADNFRKKYRYFVIRISDKTILYEGTFSMGYVKWSNKLSIEVFSISKTGEEESSTKKTIHVNSPHR